MDNDRLEILIGKFIDGEIEPSEQRLLEAQLAADPQSRRLFEQYRQLHETAQSQIAPLAETGRPFDNIFAVAWKQSHRNRRRIVIPLGIGRFVAGMAAGLLLAVLVQTAIQPAAQLPTIVELPQPPERIAPHAAAGSPIIQDVDYYDYIDANGGRWLIEGFREHIKPQRVSYQDI